MKVASQSIKLYFADLQTSSTTIFADPALQVTANKLVWPSHRDVPWWKFYNGNFLSVHIKVRTISISPRDQLAKMSGKSFIKQVTKIWGKKCNDVYKVMFTKASFLFKAQTRVVMATKSERILAKNSSAQKLTPCVCNFRALLCYNIIHNKRYLKFINNL